VETEGLAFLAPEPLSEVQQTKLWNGRLGLAARLASRPHITFVMTHLANARRRAPERVRQLEKLLPWAAGLGVPRVLMGDFNADPDAPEMQPVLAAYRDAWVEGAARKKAAGAASGSTRANRESRIDYLFYTPDAGLMLESVEVLDTSNLRGREASDHRPVIATFRVTADDR
jgi:endonuclease/exonuclease/phosphatase family metal-dependent hydrolase